MSDWEEKGIHGVRGIIMAELILRNGKIVSGEGIVNGGIAVEEGKIVAMGPDQLLIHGTQTIDVGGRYILPGLVDPESHVGAKFPFEEDIQSESCAALAGGVTTWGIQLSSRMLDPQLASTEENAPVSKTFPAFQRAGDQHCRTDYFLTPVFVTEDQVMEIPELARKFGMTSFKFFLHLQSQRMIKSWRPASWYGFKESLDDGFIYLGLDLTAQLGPPGVVCLHPENEGISRIFAERLLKAGRRDLSAWEEKEPPFCEAGHIRTWAYYARAANCPVYFMHVTTQESVSEIVEARARGGTVFGQVGAEYLSLDRKIWKKSPPLRAPATIAKLWEALSHGDVDSTGSDHVNIKEPRNKIRGEDVWSMISGYPSRVEAHLPILLSDGVHQGRISLPRVVQIACENPAKIFGLYPRKGTLQVGSDADMVIVDLDLVRKVSNDQILSSSGWTMWEGREMKGWPVMVVLRGNVVMEWPVESVKPKIIGPPRGKYLPRVLGQARYSNQKPT
jgi:dihydropyrimidinase